MGLHRHLLPPLLVTAGVARLQRTREQTG